MTDDLVKRLRNPIGAMRPTLTDGREAADRIEELEAKLSESEALLAKAVEALEDLVKDCEADYPPSHGAMKYYAQRTLADLTGGKDE